MKFEGVHTGIAFDMEAAMNVIFGRTRPTYSSFITWRDMCAAENASDEELEPSDADDQKYNSFGKIRGIDF